MDENHIAVHLKGILDHLFKNPELLEQALIRKDLIEKLDPQKKQIGLRCQSGLDTLGDAVLNLCIVKHFYRQDATDPSSLDNKRQKYGKNETLHRYAKDCLKLYDIVQWSDNEKKQQTWKASSVVLATCFEALIGALFLDWQHITGVEKLLEELDFYHHIDTML